MFVTEQPVLFIDDDETLRQANAQSLSLAGIDVKAFSDAQTALAEVDRDFAGAIISDIRMPRMDGLQLFERVKEIDPEIPLILITGHADVHTAVKALRDGAFDFLPKPYAPDHLIGATVKALQTRRLVIENRSLRAALDEAPTEALIGDSAIMVRLREFIVQVAKADIDVLVEGETGSGKELVARLLHQQGPRRGRAFVAVNCGALPEQLAAAELFGGDPVTSGGTVRRGAPGRIEASSGGTLFLDEVDSMTATVQASMLRVLEEREVMPIGGDTPRPLNLRVIAASKRDLQAEADAGRFRRDLFYRLNVVRLRVPPLRERRADVPQLFAHFLQEALHQVGRSTFKMSDEVRRHLLEHDWPGNVRELRNFTYSVVLDLPHVGTSIEGSADGLSERVERFEASLIRDALKDAGGSIRVAMEQLRLPRKTLYDKLARHGIYPNDYRTRS